MRQVPAALEVLTDLSMRHPSFSPALAERAKMLMGLREWEQVSIGGGCYQAQNMRLISF